MKLVLLMTVVFFVVGCGVKGKPLPPLKKTETTEQLKP